MRIVLLKVDLLYRMGNVRMDPSAPGSPIFYYFGNMRERLLSLFFFFCVALVSAQAPYVFQHAFNGDAEVGSKFGWSLAASTDWVAVGLPFSGPGNLENGAVAIYATADLAAGVYAPVQVVHENIGPVNDQKFGATLACSNTLLAVSNCSKRATETYCNDAAEWVSLFQWNGTTWQELQQLQRPPWATGGTYGRALAVSNEVLAVGGTRSFNGTVTRDVVYLYTFQNGGFTSLPTDSVDGSPYNTSAADDLGHALALDGNTLLVGSAGDGELGAGAGAVFIYDKDLGGNDQWGLVRKLLASNGRAEDRFGYDVGVNGTRAVVGAPGREQNGMTAGMAYVFDRDHGFSGNWGQVDSLAPLVPEEGRVFGATVAISGDRVAIGAPPPPLGDNGIAEVFAPDAGGWTRVQRIDPYAEGHVNSENRAANCIAFSGNSLLIGTPWASITHPPGDPTGGVLRYTQDVVGINETARGSLRVWPVPFSEVLHVELAAGGGQGPLVVEVTDVLGRVVRTERISASGNVLTLARAAMTTGYYQVHVSNVHGDVVSGPHRVIAQ
jgi:hypothetical protein